MITEQNFYQAACESDGCGETLPDEETHEASHWMLSYLIEQLAEKCEAGRGELEVTWFYDGEHTFCPKHHPGARPCGTCDGQGAVRVPGPPPQWEGRTEWTSSHHWDECPECHWVGYHPAPQSTAQDELGERCTGKGLDVGEWREGA